MCSGKNSLASQARKLSGTSTFTNYEDDGRSQAWTSGASATQRFDVAAPTAGKGLVTVTLGSVDGAYAGKPATRGYDLAVHTNTAPSAASPSKRSLLRSDASVVNWSS